MVDVAEDVAPIDGSRAPVDTRRSSFGFYAPDGSYVNTSGWGVAHSRDQHDRYLAAMQRHQREDEERREATIRLQGRMDDALDASEAHFATLSESGPEERRAEALAVLDGLRAVRGVPARPLAPDPVLTALAEPTRLLGRLRAGGWTVGVHNDYRLGGVAHTFWLMTHPDGTFLKGEGATDAEALAKVMDQVESRAARTTHSEGDEA